MNIDCIFLDYVKLASIRSQVVLHLVCFLLAVGSASWMLCCSFFDCTVVLCMCLYVQKTPT
jgi:hypothetical protein